MFCILALVAMVGCNTSPTTTTAAPVPQAVATASVATAPAFKNAKGQLACPVTGELIASPEAAFSHQVYNGTDYYFCCKGCADEFASDPGKFEGGKAMAAAMLDGDEAHAHCDDEKKEDDKK